MKKLTKKGLEGYVKSQWATMEKGVVDLSRNKKFRGTPEQYKKVTFALWDRFDTNLYTDKFEKYYELNKQACTVKRKPVGEVIARIYPGKQTETQAVILEQGDYLLTMIYDFRVQTQVEIVITIEPVKGIRCIGKCVEEDNMIGYCFAGNKEKCVRLIESELAAVNTSAEKLIKNNADVLEPISKWTIFQNKQVINLKELGKKGAETTRSKEIATYMFPMV